MKSGLAFLYDKVKKFEAEIGRYGTRKNHLGEEFLTVCLVNLTYNGVVLVDHVWIRDMNFLLEAGDPPEVGSRVSFKGRVDMFPKGSYQVDFHIVDVTEFKEKKKKKAA